MSSKRLVFEETSKTMSEVRNKNKSKSQKFGNSYIAKQQAKRQSRRQSRRQSKRQSKQDRLIKARKLKRARENQRQFKMAQTFISHDDDCSYDCICYAEYFPDFTPSELKEMNDYYNSYDADHDCEYLANCNERSCAAHYVSEVDCEDPYLSELLDCDPDPYGFWESFPHN